MLKARLERLEDALKCRICLCTRVECVFCPCGHPACCLECAGKVDTCPLCRSNVDRTQRIYLPGTDDLDPHLTRTFDQQQFDQNQQMENYFGGAENMDFSVIYNTNAPVNVLGDEMDDGLFVQQDAQNEMSV